MSAFRPDERLAICGSLANVTAVCAKIAKGAAHGSSRMTRDAMSIEIQNIRDQLELMENAARIPRYKTMTVGMDQFPVQVNPENKFIGTLNLVQDEPEPANKEFYEAISGKVENECLRIRDTKSEHERIKRERPPSDEPCDCAFCVQARKEREDARMNVCEPHLPNPDNFPST